MRALLLSVAALLALAPAGCEEAAPQALAAPDPRSLEGGPFADVPPVDLPVEIRQKNWGPSCMYASFVPLLRWGGRPDVAAWVRANYSGGAGIEQIAAAMQAAGVPCEEDLAGDEDFLQWASDRRLGAAIFWDGGTHAITFLGFVGQHDDTAVLLDDNFPERPYSMERRAFVAKWRASLGRAITPLLTPPPPRPWYRSES
jgi:hypothetical protein